MKPTLERENERKLGAVQKWLAFTGILILLVLLLSRGFWFWVAGLVPFAITFVYSALIWVGLLKPGSIFRSWIIVACLAGLVAFPAVFAWASFTYLHRFNQVQETDEKLHVWMQTHEMPPQTLEEAGIEAEGITYLPDSVGNTWELRFTIPGWMSYSTADTYRGTDEGWDWD